MKISKSKRVFSLLIATTFALFGLLVLCPFDVFADSLTLHITYNCVGSFPSNRGPNLYLRTYGYSPYDYINQYTWSGSFDFVCDSSVSKVMISMYYVLSSNMYPQSVTINGVQISYDSTNPTVLSFSTSLNIVFSDFVPYTSGVHSQYWFSFESATPTPIPTPTPTPTPTPSPTPDPADWLANYIFNHTSEDMWVGVEDINADDVTYDVIPAWSYKNFYFKRNTTYRIIARTEQDNVYYSLQYYTDLYNYVPLEYSTSPEGWYTYTEMPYTSINISTGSDTNTSGIYTFVRFRHDLPTLPPVTPEPGSSSTPGFSNPPYVTPIPGNPTLIPDNSTPTPIPDISGEAVAGFNKLTNIFNGIFDAAYQSVNAANGNFWTSFFFIGLPIFLVLLGLIAWIIFGSSDDD